MAPTLVTTFASLSGSGIQTWAGSNFDFWGWTAVTVPAWVSSLPIGTNRAKVFPAGRQSGALTNGAVNLAMPMTRIEVVRRTDAGTERPTIQPKMPGVQLSAVIYSIDPGWVLTLTFWNY